MEKKDNNIVDDIELEIDDEDDISDYTTPSSLQSTCCEFKSSASNVIILAICFVIFTLGHFV